MPESEEVTAAPGEAATEAATAGDTSTAKIGSKGKGDGKARVRGTRIHMRNLSDDMTTEKLRSLFEGYGQIIALEAKANEDGKCKGFGFIVFAKKEEATKAIAEGNDKEVDGKKMIVVLAENKEKGKGKDGKGDDGKGKGKKGGYAYPGYGGYDGYGGYGYAGYSYPPYSYGMMPGYGYGGAMMPYGFGYPGMPYGYGSYPPAPAAGMDATSSEEATLAYFCGDGKVTSSKGSEKTEVTAPAPPADKVFNGKLKYKSNKNGYGFITCTEVKSTWNRDAYLENDDMPANMKVGDSLNFNIELSSKGHPRAKNVTIAS